MKTKNTTLSEQLQNLIGWIFGVYRHSQQYFRYIMATTFSDGRSRSTRRVECILFYNIQSRAQTHAVSVIGLYELLGNPTK